LPILLGNKYGNTLTGTLGNDTMLGLSGNDTLNGATGNDVLIGGVGKDTLIGGAGADMLDGGSDTDTASYAASNFGINVSLATGLGRAGDAEGDTLINIENLTGSAYDDTLEGNRGNNRLAGGAGIDTVSYEHAEGGVTINLASTSGQNTGGAGTDTLSGFENLTGSDFNDALKGTSSANVLIGLDGNDVLFGNGGADTLIGGEGNDILNGGAGADLMTGGNGSDKFVFAVASDSQPGTPDIIIDFLHGTDVLDLSAIDANTGRRGNQAFGFDGQNASVVANSVTWFESAGNTVVQADVNGNATADFVLVLKGTNLQLTAMDLLL
jgi:Ca2+-binding RTX toxin-like protein